MKIGFTAGAFDLLHAGHVAMLKEAKQQCDYLVVGLHIDPSVERISKNKPIQTIVERYIQLAAVEGVDEVVPYQTEQDLIDILHLFRVDIRVVGADYRDKAFTGKDETDVYYNRRDHGFSTTRLRERVIAQDRRKAE